MKFKVNSRELAHRLANCIKIVNTRSTLPILSSFLLEIKGSTLYITADNTEERITADLKVSDVEGQGIIAIEAKTLFDSIRELPNQDIEFRIDDNSKKIDIIYYKGEFNIVGYNGAEYPEVPSLSDKVKQSITLESSFLHNVIQSIFFAVSNDVLRPTINGIYFDIDTNGSSFVATDREVIVKIKTELCYPKRSFILPNKAAALIKGLLAKGDEKVEIDFDLNRAVFKVGHYSVSSRFIEGKYPDYNSPLQIESPNKIEFSRDSLLGILKRVSILGEKQSSLVCLDITGNELTISARDLDYSTAAKESSEIEYTGNPIKLGFKSNRLIELLNNMVSDKIEMCFSEPTKPILFKPVISDYEQTSMIGTLDV